LPPVAGMLIQGCIPGKDIMKKIKNYRFWLFYLLVACAVYLMAVSFIGPWWSANIVNAPGQPGPEVNILVNIYQWGIPEGYFSEHFSPDITPAYQVILARVFFATGILLALASPWLKKMPARVVLILLGTGWAVWAAGAFFMICQRTAAYGIPLQGSETVYDYMYVLQATSSFKPAYFMGITAGLVCIVLGITREIITGINYKVDTK